MPNAKDASVGEPRTFLFYGNSGTGKTRSIRAFPKPMYVFNFDNHIQPLVGLDIDFDTYHDRREGNKVISGLEPAYKKLRSFEEKCPYETVVFDNLSALEDSAAHRSAEENNRDKVKYMDFGSASTDIRDWLYRLKMLDSLVIVIAHEGELEDTTEGGRWIYPALCGKKLPTKVMNILDETYRFTVSANSKQESEYVALTRATNKYKANTRLETTPSKIAWTNKEFYDQLVDAGVLQSRGKGGAKDEGGHGVRESA